MLTQISHQMGDLIAQRYCVQSVLGQGSSGITFAVEDVHTHQHYALKALSLKGIQDWKQLELFEREAKVLSQLDHAEIPNYIDYFQADTQDNRYFYIVQELAPGRSLADLVQDGWRASHAEVRQLAVQLLDILQYLHSFNPPIIHRDIKPQNIIRNEEGQIYLVDFGAVQTVYHHTMAGSTVVGTYGYMAPEHFQGKAVPATDFYSLGATLLFLLTHCSPADLPQQRLKIDFRQVVQLPSHFADWLDRLLEPAVEDRWPSAQVALAALTQPPTPARPQSLSQRRAESLRCQPKGSKIQLQRTSSQLTVDIPPGGLRGKTLGVGLFALFCEGFSFAIAASIATSLFKGHISAGIAIVAVIPLLTSGTLLIAAVLFGLIGKIRLQIDPQQFQLRWSIDRLGLRFRKRGRTQSLDGIKLTTAYRSNDRPVSACTLIEGDQLHKFGTLLSLPEKEWLVREISDFLWWQRN